MNIKSDLDTLKIDGEPCPFCGSKNLRLSIKREFVWPRWVMCLDCAARGPLVDCTKDDDKKAIKAWNKRRD